jgi:hypothetical protein
MTSVSQKLHERVGNFGARVIGDAGGGAFNIFHQPVEVIAGVGDADDTDGRLIPEQARIKFSDGDVERRTDTVLQAARNLALVFQRMRCFDTEFEGKKSDHREFISLNPDPSL